MITLNKDEPMNELVNISGNLSLDELASKLGATSGNTKGPSIPTLKINSRGEDTNGVQIPLGAFFLNTPIDDRVYAKDGVAFQALSNKIQYQHWGEEGLINKSILLDWAKEEGRDMLGGYNCNMPTYEQSRNFTEEERKQYNGIDRYRIVRGLVSYKGTTSSGEERVIENQPCVLSLKRKNYGPFYHDVLNRMGDKKLWDFSSLLKADKVQSPKGATYYVMRFEPQFGSPIPMSQDIHDSLSAVLELIDSENGRIEDAWKKSNTQHVESALDDDLADTLEELEQSFDEAV
jgi:hypothetical protein|tara:strand:+ start:3732 stop:4601 length:870 start_codon:yes stop_codon:yes gene_type:complete